MQFSIFRNSKQTWRGGKKLFAPKQYELRWESLRFAMKNDIILLFCFHCGWRWIFHAEYEAHELNEVNQGASLCLRICIFHFTVLRELLEAKPSHMGLSQFIFLFVFVFQLSAISIIFKLNVIMVGVNGEWLFREQSESIKRPIRAEWRRERKSLCKFGPHMSSC